MRILARRFPFVVVGCVLLAKVSGAAVASEHRHSADEMAIKFARVLRDADTRVVRIDALGDASSTEKWWESPARWFLLAEGGGMRAYLDLDSLEPAQAIELKGDFFSKGKPFVRFRLKITFVSTFIIAGSEMSAIHEDGFAACGSDALIIARSVAIKADGRVGDREDVPEVQHVEDRSFMGAIKREICAATRRREAPK